MEDITTRNLGEHIGAVYGTELTIKKQDNGEWRAVQRVTQKISDDLDSWEERMVDFEAKDRNLERAVAEAAILATLYLESINYDLFNAIDKGEYLQ